MGHYLTAYRVREAIGAAPGFTFEDVLRGDIRDGRLQTLDPSFPIEARLFALAPEHREPDWARFLRTGFEELELTATASNRAVLVVRVKRPGKKPAYLAFTFGTGRFLLRNDVWERDWGLRVALNVIFEGDTAAGALDLNRIRRVDGKTIAQNTMFTARQANRHATFDMFSFDVHRDLLYGITGRPKDEKTWGAQITGKDPVNVHVEETLEGIGKVCKRLLNHSERVDYKERFEWVDNVKQITDPTLEEELDKLVVKRFREADTGFELAPPELVDWGTLQFSYGRDPREDLSELSAHQLFKALEDSEALEEIELDDLRKLRIEAADANGDILQSWPLFACLDLEFEYDQTTYLLTGGAFYSIDPNYHAELNAFVKAVPVWADTLPDSKQGLTEGEYNILAAASSKSYLLLDKCTVRVSSKTTPIEVCDVLTASGALVHVKRHLSSSSLSHLFAQGSVSGQLLRSDRDFVRAVGKTVASAAKKDKKASKPFTSLFKGGETSCDTVVYAIAANWNGRSMVEALPFFSKVNLRTHANALRSVGFGVFVSAVEEE